MANKLPLKTTVTKFGTHSGHVLVGYRHIGKEVIVIDKENINISEILKLADQLPVTK